MADYAVIQGDLNAKGRKFALVVSRYNEFISAKLMEGALDCLQRHGASPKDITVCRVPGSFEIPVIAKKLAETKSYDAVICLGAVIRGATSHFDFVAGQAAKGIAQAGMETGVPVIFGVITTETLEQAIDRAGARTGNRGAEAALSAIEMANLIANISKQ
ncbi:MAG TPA: 6,7-dimethyl-8-ribityllumazine synthase [Candidatus Brocadiia bacterium]|nr:6,7-dimethyl-8-ribityllumazine synthase [Candidatus Brocadiia bacterium]